MTRSRLDALFVGGGEGAFARWATVLLLLSACASASTAQSSGAARDGRVVLAAEPATDAEAAVRDRLAEPGLHIVHFWAPWCGNSRAELRGPDRTDAHDDAFASGLPAADSTGGSTPLRTWADLIAARPDVQVTFVTIYNDGETAAEALEGYGIDLAAPNFALYAQPDFGPSRTRDLRRRTFLGLPITWTPTTWVFHKRGRLAYAFNYGEVAMPDLDDALNDAASSWAHD